MRVGLYLVAAAGLLLSGCASMWPTDRAAVAGGPADKPVTSQAAPQAAPSQPPAPWYARNGGCAAWDQNAYHYECDSNANY